MNNYFKKFLEGFSFSFGIIFFLSLIGIVYSVGFHNANEILSGTFIGNYIFNGSLGVGNNFDAKFTVYKSNPGQLVSFYGENHSLTDSSTRVKIKDLTGNVDWYISANNDGSFAIHQSEIGDRMFIDNNTGNIGIGNINPKAKLDVLGNIKIRETTIKTCDSTIKGSIHHDSTENSLCICLWQNGIGYKWFSVTAGTWKNSTACTQN